MKQKSPLNLKKLLSKKKAPVVKVEDSNNLKVEDQTISKVQKVLESLGQLFQPFKDLLLNIFPSSKKIIKIIDFIGLTINKLILIIASSIPLSIKFLKGKAFKIIVIALIIIILINATLSRVLSSVSYKAMIAKAIENTTGYQTVIEGTIRVNLLTMSVNLGNAGFYNSSQAGKGLVLSKLSVSSLHVSFAYLPILIGELKVKDISMQVANITYTSANAGSDSSLGDKFNDLKINLTNIANLKMVLPKVNTNPLDRGDSNSNLKFIDQLNNLNSNTKPLNKSNNDEVLGLQGRLLSDNDEKYLNLDGVFNVSNKVKQYTEVNVDKNNLVYIAVNSLVKRLRISYAGIKSLNYSGVNVSLLDANNKQFLFLANLSGKFKTSFTGKHEFSGVGELFNNTVYFKLLESDGKVNDKFSLALSYSDDSLQSNDINVSGSINNNGSIAGEIKSNAVAFSKIISPGFYNIANINAEKTGFISSFKYTNSTLSLPNMQITLNGTTSSGALIYDFANDSVLSINLNLQVKNLNDLIDNFNQQKQIKFSDRSNFAAISDMLISWRNSKTSFLSAKIINLDLTIKHAILNNTPLDKFNASLFLDEDNNLYVTNLEINNSNLDVGASGKLTLSGKTGALIVKTNGSISDLCSYMGCENNLFKLISAIANNHDSLNLEAKMFLSDNRLVFNDIMGNIGDKLIQNTNAALVTRSDGSDLAISSQFNSLNFSTLQAIYNFNKQFNGLYYNSNNNFTGIPSNLTMHLNLYSNNFYYKQLVFKNFQMDTSLVSGGVLVHNFQMNTVDNSGSIKGSYNFDNKVTPSLVGNINFNNVMVEAANLNNILFNNYKLSGRVVVNGNINIAGDDYYSGINRVSGNLSLVKYERLKINQSNDSEGLYLTLSKANVNGQTVYQIGDLYSNISINNNLINFSPVVIRFVDGKVSYRGTFSGGLDLIANNFNLNGNLQPENNYNHKLNFNVVGSLLSAIVSPK